MMPFALQIFLAIPSGMAYSLYSYFKMDEIWSFLDNCDRLTVSTEASIKEENLYVKC